MAIELLELETESQTAARDNVNIAMQAFRLGKISALELKEAQRSMEDAQARLVEARYSAKLAETELKRLNGELVK